MFGYVEWSHLSGRSRGEKTEERRILNLPFCCVGMQRRERTPDFLLRRRALAAAGRLRREGVVRAVFPEAFPYVGLFERRGVRPVDALPLFRALTGELIRGKMAEQGLSERSAVIALSADRMSADLERAVTEISIRSRYVLLNVPYGGEELCRRLRREYGVSLLLTGEREKLEQADVLALYAPRPDLSGKNRVLLPLYPGAELPPVCLRLPPELEEKLPRGCRRPELLAALFEAGAVRAGQIGAESGTLCP